MPRVPRYFWVLIAAGMGFAADRDSAIRAALSALNAGDFQAAEKTLAPEVASHPADGGLLTLLGVALDGEKKFKQAEEIHRRAAAAAPTSADVWNNYANHLLNSGDPGGAEKLYQRVLALDPSSYNANVQLARLAVKKKDGAAALTCLDRLSAERQQAPNLVPLRLAALYLANRTAEADQLAAHWRDAAKGDLAANFAIGLALADAGKLDGAETFFTQALAVAPSDFNVLFNLGVVEWDAGHYQRAREVLEAAERQQSENADLLYALACVAQAEKRLEDAVALAARAAHVAPERADIQKLLAVVTGDLGALEDSAAAWDRYLKLEPKDDLARRERGFTEFRMGRFAQALQDLRWYVARHPGDADGHYELGLVENQDTVAAALAEFSLALELRPDFAAARSARGSLYYQMGKPDSALPDLETALHLNPDDAVALDRLGQTYSSLDRPADAVRVLRKAVELAPDDSKTLFHLARALADAGLAEESKAAMDRFRQLGPAVHKGVPGGFVDYLSLTPEDRHADYRRRVERVVSEHPEDASAQAKYLGVLLEDGESQKALDVAHKIASFPAPATILAEAGHALLAAGEYATARELLEKAAASTPWADLEVDLAIAAFHTSGPQEGLRLLDRLPESARRGEYYLARAEMLEASGKASEAVDAVELALLPRGPIAPTLYFRGCLLLLRTGEVAEALRISAQAVESLGADRRVLLLRAVVLELGHQTDYARKILEQIQNRSPEWPAAWAADGIILGIHGQPGEARKALQTAISLGAAGPEVKRCLDQVSSGAGVNSLDLFELLLVSTGRLP